MKLAIAPKEIAEYVVEYIKASDALTLVGMNKAEEICDWFEANADMQSILIFNAMIVAVRDCQNN